MIAQPVLLFGGGVSGLFARAALARAGMSTLLVESSALGSGQTIASQGILHRGVKYALSSAANQAAIELARAQVLWEDAMMGDDASPRIVDLRSLATLTRTMYLWTKPGLFSSLAGSLTGTAAALAMKSGVIKLQSGNFPPPFAGAPAGVHVWQVQETCIDPRSLLTLLAGAHADDPRHRIIRAERTTTAIEIAARYNARALVLCAGCGNEALLQESGHNPAHVCQRRPLHMVVVRAAPFDLFAHCLQELSDKPRLTITTSHASSGERIWYIGGQIAETGIVRDAAAQIHAARAELQACMPWVALPDEASWSTHWVERAEGRTAAGTRPDGPVVHELTTTVQDRTLPLLACWPTKLALAPAMAVKIVTLLSGYAPVTPTASNVPPDEHEGAPVAVAEYPWM